MGVGESVVLVGLYGVLIHALRGHVLLVCVRPLKESHSRPIDLEQDSGKKESVIEYPVI